MMLAPLPRFRGGKENHIGEPAERAHETGPRGGRKVFSDLKRLREIESVIARPCCAQLRRHELALRDPEAILAHIVTIDAQNPGDTELAPR
jgi:hypothetical protein